MTIFEKFGYNLSKDGIKFLKVAALKDVVFVKRETMKCETNTSLNSPVALRKSILKKVTIETAPAQKRIQSTSDLCPPEHQENCFPSTASCQDTVSEDFVSRNK